MDNDDRRGPYRFSSDTTEFSSYDEAIAAAVMLMIHSLNEDESFWTENLLESDLRWARPKESDVDELLGKANKHPRMTAHPETERS